MNIEEVQEPETTKIYRQNPLPSVADTRKLRKFTDETNMQARNHENSDEICAQPVRHLDLSTPAFTITVRTPSVTTLFGEKRKCIQICNLQPLSCSSGRYTNNWRTPFLSGSPNLNLALSPREGSVVSCTYRKGNHLVESGVPWA